jgi:predicted metal-dependent peptidase
LYFNPEFVLSLPRDELGGVLLHEVHHVALGHLTIDRSNYPDAWALTVALEISVNEFVKEPLPGQPITLQRFPMLPPMESSDQRYQRLKKIMDRCVLASPSTVTGGAEHGTLCVPDEHSLWQDAEDDPETIRQILADVIQQAAMEAGGMPQELLDATRDIGALPGVWAEPLEGANPGQVDWRQLLRRHTGHVLELRPVFNRPPRRFPELVGIIPGRLRSSGKVSVVAIFDTSGSISQENLEAIDGELHRLSRKYRVQVVECDCKVRRVYRYHQRLKHVEGRGGTDFRPALDPAFLRPLRPGVILYFTDGLGEAPSLPPAWPLIWCLVPGGQPPCSWGRVIEITAYGAEK